jgi:putative proteasome-type protease
VTFCLGIKVSEGLVGIADTRVISGNETISARKITVYEIDGRSVFLMTSGLRSVRDKAVTYFEEALSKRDDEPLDRLFKVANAFSHQIRRVDREDREALEASDLSFNMFALMGGQMSEDGDHKLYLIYPQGNWVEIAEGTPYHIIGSAGYGKPVLDRTLKYQDSLRFALKVGCLAFDSTRISAADVDFPVDVVVYFQETGQLHQRRFEKEELLEISDGWQEHLRTSVATLPSTWLDAFFEDLGAGRDSIPETLRTLRSPN